MKMHPRPGLLCALIWLAAAHAAVAQPAPSATWQRIETRSYHFEEAGRVMEYALFVPSSWDHARPAPLIIALHGLGSTPAQIMRYQALTDLAEARGYVVAAPMGYNPRGWYGSLGQGRPAIGSVAGDPENLGALSQKDVLNVLDIVVSELRIDESRIFVLGHSMGGGGALHLGRLFPERFAALAAVAPAFYESPDALDVLRHTPVLILQGERDALVRAPATRRLVDRMREIGMPHRYIEIEGGDHTRIIAASPENMRAIFDFFDAAPGR